LFIRVQCVFDATEIREHGERLGRTNLGPCQFPSNHPDALRQVDWFLGGLLCDGKFDMKPAIDNAMGYIQIGGPLQAVVFSNCLRRRRTNFYRQQAAALLLTAVSESRSSLK
jgi:hypothetical protein